MNFKLAIRAVFIIGTGLVLIAPFTFLKPPKVSKPEQMSEPAKVVVKPKPVEKPLHNVKLPDFGAIKDIRQKKQMFFDFMRPSIVKENDRLLGLRQAVDEIVTQLSLGEPLTKAQEQQFAALVKKYRIKGNHSALHKATELYDRLDIVPSSLVLVQAANESAWGTSRFARIGLNFFGIWCYTPGCGMVPRSRNEGAKHEVEAFQSVDAAVVRYLHNINTNSAYEVLRTIRQQLREQGQPLIPEILATGLLPYSERGTDYVLEITQMLRHNQQYLGEEETALAE